MIQRIQTIYLLLVLLISGGLIFVFPLWENNLTNKVYALDLLSNDNFFLKIIPVLFCLTALLSLTTIFKFKNRKLQFVLGRLIILINLLLLGLLIYISQNLSGEMQVSMKDIGMIIPVVVILLIVLANKAIKKDENLVKSADRIR